MGGFGSAGVVYAPLPQEGISIVEVRAASKGPGTPYLERQRRRAPLRQRGRPSGSPVPPLFHPGGGVRGEAEKAGPPPTHRPSSSKYGSAFSSGGAAGEDGLASSSSLGNSTRALPLLRWLLPSKTPFLFLRASPGEFSALRLQAPRRRQRGSLGDFHPEREGRAGPGRLALLRDCQGCAPPPPPPSGRRRRGSLGRRLHRGTMSLGDPFFVVKGEVQKAVNTTRGLYDHWCQLLEESHVNKEEIDWTTNELRNSLRSIEWDLEDLEETICIVESNPHKFRIEPSEIAGRRSFITEMRESVKEMRDHLASPAAQAFINKKSQEALLGSKENYGLLGGEELLAPNSRTLEEQQLHQKLIIEEQDEQLEMVSGSIRVLRHMSGRVGEELEEQSVMLEDFAHEMDGTHSRMDGVLTKMSRVSHMGNGRRQWCIIGLVLVVVVVALILLFSSVIKWQNGHSEPSGRPGTTTTALDPAQEMGGGS